MLTEHQFLYRRPRLLFACNKSDLAEAKSPEDIQKMLEIEMTLLKDRASQIPSEVLVPVGVPGEPFEFAEDCPLDVFITLLFHFIVAFH